MGGGGLRSHRGGGGVRRAREVSCRLQSQASVSEPRLKNQAVMGVLVYSQGRSWRRWRRAGGSRRCVCHAAAAISWRTSSAWAATARAPAQAAAQARAQARARAVAGQAALRSTPERQRRSRRPQRVAWPCPASHSTDHRRCPASWAHSTAGRCERVATMRRRGRLPGLPGWAGGVTPQQFWSVGLMAGGAARGAARQVQH